MSINELERTRELEVENSWLKKMSTELALENTVLKDVLFPKVITPAVKRAAVGGDDHHLLPVKGQSLADCGPVVDGVVWPRVDWLVGKEVIAKQPRWGFRSATALSG